jgi:hypothetical protein
MQFPQTQVNQRDKIIGIFEASGLAFDGLNDAVDGFGERIGNPVFEIANNSLPMAFDSFGRLDHRPQAAMGGPEIPVFQF